MGYTDTFVFVMVLIESLLLSVLAAALGLGIAATVFPAVFSSFGLSGLALPLSVWLMGFAIAGGLAVSVAVWPAWRTRRLSIAAAVSGR